MPSPSARVAFSISDIAITCLLTLLATCLYLFTPPAVVNLDGLGYLKLLPHNYAAGHLLYMPLLRAAASLCGGDGLLAGRRLDATAAGLSVGLLYGCSRTLLSRPAALLSALGFAVSYGVWVQGSDVEAYACALLALLVLFTLLLAYRAHPSTEAAVAVGVALGIAVLTHLTHVLATPFVALWLRQHAPTRRAALTHPLLAPAIGAALSLLSYAFAAFGVRHTDLTGALTWVSTAGHGFHYSGTLPARLADSLYGLAKAFIWSPYLYEANAQTLLTQFVLGLSIAAFLLGAIIARRRFLPSLPYIALATWTLPYALMALAFFGSDHERWLFILPVFWMVAAAAIDTLPHPRLIGLALLFIITVANATSAIAPAMHDTWDRTRAEAAGVPLRDGDLVIFPGHSWDEYVWLYGRHAIHPLPIAYYAGLLGKDACFARIEREMTKARATGNDVYVLRLPDDHGDETGDTRGFYELSTLGISPEALRAYFSRFDPQPIPTPEPKVTLYRLRVQ